MIPTSEFTRKALAFFAIKRKELLEIISLWSILAKSILHGSGMKSRMFLNRVKIVANFPMICPTFTTSNMSVTLRILQGMTC